MQTSKRGTGAKYGKANIRKVLEMADKMAGEAREALKGSGTPPDWAGLAWIISSFYNPSGVRQVERAMGPEWFSRAGRIARALEIAFLARQADRFEKRFIEKFIRG